MGLLELLFGKKKAEPIQQAKLQPQQTIMINTPQTKKGLIKTIADDVNANNIEGIKHSYIALDLETTGLSSYNDKIIEVGAVKFVDGNAVERYNSLIKIDSHIPDGATRVNHITDDMLNAQGKEPAIVYKELADFLADALNDNTFIVAHNASFDVGFLFKAFEDYGHSGTLRYLDTLKISRANIKGLESYKQPTVASYFGITNTAEHRAVSDAEACGYILAKLLDLSEIQIQKQIEKAEKALLNDEEKETGAVLLTILESGGADISKFRLYKNSSNYIDVVYVYTFIKFKITRKSNYIIIPKNHIPDSIDLEVGECTKSENDYSNVRVYFENPFELQKISNIIVNFYQEFYTNGNTYDGFNKYEGQFFANATNMTKLDNIDSLIESAKQRIIDNTEAKIKSQELEQEQLKKQEEKKLAKKLKEEQAEQKKLDAELEKQKMKALLENADSYSIDTIKTIVEMSASNNKRAVIKLDDDGDIFKIYGSVADASDEVGIAPKTIRDVCNGRYKHGGGFCWKYADEYIK